jgi:hypothetical protein
MLVMRPWVAAFGCQNQTMRLTEKNIIVEASRLASFDRTPQGRARRKLIRIAVRGARVITGIALIFGVLALVDQLQNTPDPASAFNTGSDLLMVALAVALVSTAVIAAWFIALGRGPTSAEVLERRHARARRSLQWRNRMKRLPVSYRRLAAPGVLLVRVAPVLGVVFAIGWIYMPRTAPPGAVPANMASQVPALRMTVARLADTRPVRATDLQEVGATQTTPLFLRLDSTLRRTRTQ